MKKLLLLALLLGADIATSQSSIYPPSGPAGTVTSITAGSGLTASPNPIVGAGTISLAVPVTVPNGGTGDTSFTSQGVVVGNGTSALTIVTPNASGTQEFLGQTSSGAPTWAALVSANIPNNAANTTGSAGSFTGSLVGDVTGTQGATVVSMVGGDTAASVAAAVATVTAATNLDTPSTLVLRDGTGSFLASGIQATGVGIGIAPVATAALNISEGVNTTSSSYSGVNEAVIVFGAGANSATGLYGDVYLANSAAQTGAVYGVSGNVTAGGSGNTTIATGLYSQVGNSSTGTLATAIGVYVASGSNTGGGSVSNNYGLYLAPQAGVGTTNYALYSAGASDASYFAGSLSVNGNLSDINTVPYTWPSTQGAASTVLTNNGSGTLTWAAAAGGGIYVNGSTGTPNSITAAGGITSSGHASELQFITGNGGAVTVTANPQISGCSGTTVGYELILAGTSNTNTVTLSNGTGLDLNGFVVIGQTGTGAKITLICDGTNWSEVSRR